MVVLLKGGLMVEKHAIKGSLKRKYKPTTHYYCAKQYPRNGRLPIKPIALKTL